MQLLQVLNIATSVEQNNMTNICFNPERGKPTIRSLKQGKPKCRTPEHSNPLCRCREHNNPTIYALQLSKPRTLECSNSVSTQKYSKLKATTPRNSNFTSNIPE